MCWGPYIPLQQIYITYDERGMGTRKISKENEDMSESNKQKHKIVPGGS